MIYLQWKLNGESSIILMFLRRRRKMDDIQPKLCYYIWSEKWEERKKSPLQQLYYPMPSKIDFLSISYFFVGLLLFCFTFTCFNIWVKHMKMYMQCNVAENGCDYENSVGLLFKKYEIIIILFIIFFFFFLAAISVKLRWFFYLFFTLVAPHISSCCCRRHGFPLEKLETPPNAIVFNLFGFVGPKILN